MTLHSLIKVPTLTRELSHEFSGVGAYINEVTTGLSAPHVFVQELAEFERSSTKLKLFSFMDLYNDLEGFLQDTKEESELARFRKDFRLKFPYISAMDQMLVFFLPADKQPCAITCFFLSEVLTRIMDVHGQSKGLSERYHLVNDCFGACSSPTISDKDRSAHITVMDMPARLFTTLSPSLGKTPVLNLYQRTYDKLQSQYSSLPSFVFLQKEMEQVFDKD